MFLLVDTANIVLITVAPSVGQTFLSMMYGPRATLYAEMFTARVRYSGASLGYEGTSVSAGELAPIIMVWLLDRTGTSLSVSFYMLAMAIVTFVSVYLITETYEDEMTGDVAEERDAVAGYRAQRPSSPAGIRDVPHWLPRGGSTIQRGGFEPCTRPSPSRRAKA